MWSQPYVCRNIDFKLPKRCLYKHAKYERMSALLNYVWAYVGGIKDYSE
jgi:hypothetical protein